MKSWITDKRLIVAPLILVLFFGGCSRPPAPPRAIAIGDDGLLCDFENIGLWDISPDNRRFKLSLEEKIKTEGKYSLRVSYPTEDYPSINTKRLYPDWSGFDYLAFDVYNPQGESISFSVRVDDVTANRAQVDHPLLPEQNRVKISLRELSNDIDIKNVGFLVLFLNSPARRTTLYFDNMRLIKKEPSSRSGGDEISHPRLFFTKEDLLSLKEKVKMGPYWLKNRFMEYADVSPYWAKGEFLGKETSVYSIFTLSLVYQLREDKDYARQAIRNMLDRKISGAGDLEYFAIGFDWCYDEMSEEEREAIVYKMDKAGLEMISKDRFFRSFHNTMYGLSTAIAMCGYAIEGESNLAEKFIRFSEFQFKDAILMFNNVFIDGEWPEGMDYNRHIAFNLVKYFEIVKSATGRDLYKECDWLLDNAYFVIYTTRPDDSFYRFGDNDLPQITDWERRFLVRVASYYKDPYIQWYIDKKTEPHGPLFKHVYDVLWYDPYLEGKPPVGLPKSRFFKGLGVVIARSGWGARDTWFSFKCGDYFGDHCHLDNNSFTIFKSGSLAIDSGLYGDDFASSHWANYYSRTIAHNTVAIHNPEERFYGYERKILANDGGQEIMLWKDWDRVVPENYAYRDASLPLIWVGNEEKWETGEIKAYELTDNYCYMMGDAAAAYDSEKLNRFTREVVFIFPDYFIVLDKVSSKNPEFKKRWLLHTVNEPEIEDKEIMIREGAGRLYCRSIYPLNSSTTKVGGQYKEFFVDGKNYPHNGELFAGNIPGGWRIEIEPTEPREDDIFLSFLYAPEADTEDKPKVERIDREGVIGITMELEDLIWDVVFKKGEDEVSYTAREKDERGKLVKTLIFD